MKNLKVLIVTASIVFAVNLAPTNATPKQRCLVTAVSRQAVAPKLGDFEQFKAAFQADAGKVRLVALVSPT